jgi:hypothetical protein
MGKFARICEIEKDGIWGKKRLQMKECGKKCE